MHYRIATPADAISIAALHARSWQEMYRGIMPDSFLADEVETDRLDHWRQQFDEKPRARHIIVCEDGGQLAGFACTLANYDPEYGALLDNLHVAAACKGRGIGRGLMKQAAEWVRHHYPGSAFYVWVYEKNHVARKFYDSLGATNQETTRGEYAVMLRYVWPDTQRLITACTPLAPDQEPQPPKRRGGPNFSPDSA